MDYNLPYPFLDYRKSLSTYDLHRGSVVAFKKWEGAKERTGIIVMESKEWMLVAVNLYREEGRIWINDELPDDVELYEAFPDEKVWGMKYFLETEAEGNPSYQGKHPVIAFIDSECSHCAENQVPIASFCLDMLSCVPMFVDQSEWADLKAHLRQAIVHKDRLQFNRYRMEYYCFLMGVLMIAEHDQEEIARKSRLKLFRDNWWQFSWMYAIGIGIVLGTDFQNFTSVIHQTGHTRRKHYLHLYLPLAERFFSKICSYGVDKPEKLRLAIEKMKETEAREEQYTDLDELFAIVFPKHFTEALSNNRPAGSIADLKKEIAAKDQSIIELNAAIDNFSNSYNKVLEEFAATVKSAESNNISADDLAASFLQFTPNIALSFFGTVSTLLSHHPTWQKFAPQIKQQILMKQQQEQDNQREFNEMLKKAVETPTTIYQSGAIHNDKRLQVIQEGIANTDKLLDNKS